MMLKSHDVDVNAYVDGELELSRQLDMEGRIERDPALHAEVQRLRQLQASVRSAADYHAAPVWLRTRIGFPAAAAHAAAELDVPDPATLGAAKPGSVNRNPPVPGSAAAGRPWRPYGLALAACGLLVWGLALTPWPVGRDDPLPRDLVASHVRATLSERLVDVASSDQHTVKPWLSARLDYSPPVTPLAEIGVTFLGARVDYLDGRQVAVMVYKQRQHVVDVYVWPTRGADPDVRDVSQRGFNVKRWKQGEMTYSMVSDLNRDELGVLAQALQRDTSTR